MRRALFVTTALGLLLAGSTASPVAADDPTAFTDSDTFIDTNPCSGLPDRITVHFAGQVHQHGDRFVAHISRTGTTDSGYVMDHGVQHRQNNGQVETVQFNDRWRHADGSIFVVRGLAVFDPDTWEPQVDRFTSRCLRT
ncbi:MAG: hypothetical protein OEW42_02470 [Acidimicrobiia bacterium]|nr:hypothetical protein [Acidimicrobiia bacterium]